MGDYGPVIDKTVFGKEIQFEDIYSPNSYDNFDNSPDCGQDGTFDEHICDQIWEGMHQICLCPKLVDVRQTTNTLGRPFLNQCGIFGNSYIIFSLEVF